MRATFLGAILAGLIVGSLVVGVRAVTRDGAPSPESLPAGAEPAEEGTPESTAQRWAAAWSSGDYAAMYALLTPATQAAMSQAEFENTYSDFAVETTQASLDATATGATATQASVDVSLSTRYFGPLDYTVRLSLVDEDEGYRVAWQPSSLHPELANGQHVVSDLERPIRVTIYDRNGVVLAQTQKFEMVGLNRSIISDQAAVVAGLQQLGMTQDQITTALNSPLGASQRVPVGSLSEDLVSTAVELERTVPGILIYFESRRVHPLGPAAAHVIGYTRELTAEELEERAGQGYRVGDRIGAAGLEAALDEQLAGKPGGELRIVDAGGTLVKDIASYETVPGQDITTTLDASVLQASYDRLEGRAGALVVMAPGTNEILAITSRPSYDPDAFERGDQAAINAILADGSDPLLSRATLGTYSAGSVFKLITGAAGMAYLGLTANDTIDCPAVWTVVDPPRRNWEGAQGPLTIAGALMRSCNPVFYQIGYDLYFSEHSDGLSEMARQFGFGAPTGTVGLIDEAGLVPDAQWKRDVRGEEWYAGDNVNLAIGQGDLLITPIQLANAYSTFVTNQLRTPVLVQGQEATVEGTLPLTPDQHALLLQGLQAVTGPYGTAAYAFSAQGYWDFAGKSGTAEDAGTQQHVLFVALSPAASPRVLAAVVLDDGQSGSLEAGPIARDAVLAALAAGH
jgi:penicillin-binding protein 2